MEFIKEYWFFISGVIIPVLTYFIGKIEAKNKKTKEDMIKLKTGMCALQRNSLLRACDDYKAKGFCPMEAKETINELYVSYHELGGNSFITEMVRQVNLLPEHPGQQ